MDGQARVQLILDLKNRMKTPFSQAKSMVNSNVGDMKRSLMDLKLSHAQAFSAMSDEVPGFSRVMGLLGNPYALATAGAGALIAGAYKAGQWSNNWANGMAKVNGTAQLSKEGLSQLSDQLIDIGKRNVLPLEEIPNAFNQIVSSGLDIKQSLAALEPTLRAAKAGFSDVYTVANAGTSIMLASGENINKVYDVMFATVNKGKAEFSDMANYMPRVVSASKGLGFELGEVGGAFATLTQKFKAEQAATLMENVFKSFGTGSIRKNMELFGVKVFDKGKVRPFVSIIKDVARAVDGLSAERRSNVIEKMGFDMEARNAILSMITNVKDLKTNTDYAVNSTGELGRAYEKTAQPLDEWKTMMNELKADVIKPLGDAVLEMAVDFGHWLNSFIQGMKEAYTNSELLKGSIELINSGFKWLSSGLGEMLSTTQAKRNGNQETGQAYIKKELAGLQDPTSLTKDQFNALIDKANQYKSLYYDRLQKEKGADSFMGRYFNRGQFNQYNFDSGVYNSIDEIKKNAYNKLQGKTNPFASGKSPAKDTPGNNPLDASTIDKITGNSQATHNMTINIDAFIKGGLNMPISQNVAITLEQVQAMVKDMFLRVVADAQTSGQ